VITGNLGVIGPVLPPDEYRAVNVAGEFLSLTNPTAPAPLPTDLWAQVILDALNPPPPLTMLGTLLPENADVKKILCAEFGARWTVATTGEPDKLVTVYGMKVALAPGMLEVDAVTEDIAPAPPPVYHGVPGSGVGYLTSTAAGLNAYTNARAGSAVSVTPTYFGSWVGQGMTDVSSFIVYETFLWFDTSSIPVGATILRASFGAIVTPDWNPAESGATFTPFNVQVRSYPSGGWRTTLDAADWIAGAGSTTLRAQAPALANTFTEFQDAGSGLAGAIVKGGATQLYLVSSRTVAGTAPAAIQQYEDVRIEYPRLRVYYQ
jgi:hypothetical protein